ncbi:uncharacterized protein B0I36DRAFT_359691 [Microdochium trichocladiopsis]|uniref:Uncharacterized protein n=1 Tax=Microdochium trichocladiopsis TaxID=1682393 RepID=A0A9P9BYI4_9PEZI|nr:uncharacterized protein B0I36DRAFT_359691 [Microdochium trichocladiopsis]KAH7038083.1 hypothetical protein B0I36DRAFT_359691 [Microdochium trichocladiopsis]
MAPTFITRREDEGGPINWAALHASYIAAGVVVGFFILLLACMMIWGPGWYRRRRAKLAALERARLEQQDGIPLSPTSTQAGDSQPKTVHPEQQPATTPVAAPETTSTPAKDTVQPTTTAEAVPEANKRL